MATATTPTITRIELHGLSQPAAGRLVKVTLSNGETASIAGSYGGFEQYGSDTETFRITYRVARRYTKWLNGGACPKPLAYFVTVAVRPVAALAVTAMYLVENLTDGTSAEIEAHDAQAAMLSYHEQHGTRHGDTLRVAQLLDAEAGA